MPADRKSLLAAATMTATAGYVDAAGFLATGGFFLSFMSGNSTRAGIGLVESWAAASTALTLIGAFLTGVIAATLLGRIAQGRRIAWHRASLLLLLIASCLAASLLLLEHDWRIAGMFLIAFSMGAENLVFEKDGEVRFGVTYMTGTLVKIGQRIGWALSGGPRWQWLRYAALWSAMLLGGACGALAFLQWHYAALWGPVGVLIVLAAVLRGHDAAPSDAAQAVGAAA